MSDATSAKDALEMSPAAIGGIATVAAAVMAMLGRVFLGRHYREVTNRLGMLVSGQERIEEVQRKQADTIDDINRRLARIEGRQEERDRHERF